MNYASLSDVTSVVLEYLHTNEVPSDLEAMLTLTAGRDADGVLTYRPYWVIAQYAATAVDSIKRAEDVEFRDIDVDELFKLQTRLDGILGLDVPDEVKLEAGKSTMIIPARWDKWGHRR